MANLTQLTTAAHEKRKEHGIPAEQGQDFMAGFFEGAAFQEAEPSPTSSIVADRIDILTRAVDAGLKQFRESLASARTPDQRTASKSLIDLSKIIGDELKEIRKLL